MARPPAEELTDRELEVMHAVWDHPADGPGPAEPTVNDLRDRLAAGGRALAPTTVATLVKILSDKGFLVRATDRRPHRYRAARGFAEVSGSLVGELVRKVFGGSRAALLARLAEERLTDAERVLLRSVLDAADDRGADGGAGDE